MSNIIKILVLEHEPIDLELLDYELKRSDLDYISEVVENEPDYTGAVTRFKPDIILSDFSLPSFDGPAAFEIRNHLAPDTPFIFVSGTIGEEKSIEYIKSGVTDYALKDRLFTLVPKIKRALKEAEEKRLNRETGQSMQHSENRFRALIEKSTDMVTLTNIDGAILYGSPSISTVLGYSQEAFLKMRIFEIVHPDDMAGYVSKRNHAVQVQGDSFNHQMRLLHQDGHYIWCEGTFKNMMDEPGINALVANFHDVSEKRQLEKQREFDKNNLAALINNTVDLMWSVDLEFNLITSNIPFDEMGKVNFGNAIGKGKSVLSVADNPDMLMHFKKLYERAFSGEIFTETEHFYFPTEFWTEISYYPIRNGDLIIGAACHSRDISKIKFAEQQIISNEKRFRSLVENGADAVVILTAEGKPFYISPTVERVLGYTEAEMLQLDLFGMIHPDDLQWSVKVWEQIMVSPGLPIPFPPGRMMHKDGSWRWLEGTLTNLLHDPAVNGIVDNFRDVTVKKGIEDALQLTQFAVDNAADAIFWMTPDARIINVNEAGSSMLGFTRDELMALSVHDIDPEYHEVKWNGHFSELREKGALYFETKQQTKEGMMIPVEIKANYIKFGDAELNCAFVRDISERKNAEMEREKLTDTIIQRNRDLEQFTFIVSHNLRAPTANIIGYTEGLQEEDLYPEEQKILLKGLSTSVLQLDTIIKDINSILQIKLELNEKKEMISFSDLVGDILDGTVNAINRERIHINTDFSEVDEIFSLKVYMYSIFYNLITNSIKYGKPDEDILIEIRSHRQNGKIVLIFKDNGLGIDMKTKGDKVFGLYKRFHPHVEGKGMGLFMVKSQVEAIGGKITLTSAPDKGTEFTILFDN